MRWLHVTDLHFGTDAHESTTMLENLHQVAELTGPVDCLFITGDLRYAAKCSENHPHKAETELIELRKALGVPQERTFIVPGNHDVNSDEYLSDTVKRALTEYHQSTTKVISPKALSKLQKAQKTFEDLREKVGWKPAKTGRKKASPRIHYCVQLPDFPFNIICLNTALFCYYYKTGNEGHAQDDKKLILGRGHIDQMLEEEIDPRKPVIILAHHPLDSIHDEESEYFKHKLNKCLGDRKDIILYLCGHTHKLAMGPVYAPQLNNHTFLTCVGGTGMNVNPDHQKPDMDVFYGEINNEATKVKFRAFKWEYRRLRGWMPDSAFSYEPEQGMALDGCWYFPSETRPKDSLPNEEVKRRYLFWLKEHCGGMESIAERRGSPSPQNLNRLFVQPRLLASSFDKIRQRNEKLYEEEATSRADTFLWKPEGQSAVRMIIASDPGGGKSTLLKWFAWVYAGQEKNRSARTGLPLNEDVFPVWLSCRNLSALPSMDDIIRQTFPANFDRDRLFSIFRDYQTRGDALLLIDGLDEAGDLDRQNCFLDRLLTYLARPENQCLHVILTVRCSGLEILIGKADNRTQFQKSLDDQHFEYGVIAPLNDKEIKDLSQKWRDAYGNALDSEYTKWQIDQILESRVRELAQNPLLLTAMLLVQLRYNRLPTQIPRLYNSALEALLEGERRTPLPLALSPEEIIRSLACVALEMAKENEVRISGAKLRLILEELWKKRPDLIQRTDLKDAIQSLFFRYLDEESVILRPVTENSSAGEYEFQYRSFQDYLAALAAAEFYYADYTEKDRPGRVLEPYLTTQYWKKDMQDVILLASLISVPCGRHLARRALQELNSAHEPSKIDYLRNTLLLMLEKGTPLPNKRAEDILQAVFREQPQYTDVKSIRQILTGRYQNLMAERLRKMGEEQHGDSEYWKPLIRLLQDAKTAPYQFYRERRDAAPPRMVEGISMLSCALWLMNTDKRLSFRDIDLEHQADKLKAEMLQDAQSDSMTVRWHAFRALNHFVEIAQSNKIFPFSGKELSDYALSYMLYLNQPDESKQTSRLIPACFYTAMIDGVKEIWNSPDGAKRIQKSRFQPNSLKRLCESFKSKTPSAVDYWDLFIVAFLAAAFRGNGDLVRSLFSTIAHWRDIHWKSQPSYYRMLNGHFKIAVPLWEQMKDSEIYSPDEKKTVERYIFSMDRATILHAKENRHIEAFKPYFDVSDEKCYYPFIYGEIVKGDERDPERVCEFINERIGEP